MTEITNEIFKNKNDFKNRLIITLFLTISFIIHPLLPTLVLITLKLSNKYNHSYTNIYFILFISLAFTTQESTGSITIDIAEYKRLFYVNTDFSLLRLNYPMYDFIQKVFYYLGSSFKTFIFSIYLFFFFCIHFIYKKEVKSDSWPFIILTICLINLVQTGELIRQNLATLIFIFSIYNWKKSKILSIILMVVSLSFHTSIMFYTLIFFTSFNLYTSLIAMPILLTLSFYNQNELISAATCNYDFSIFGMICYKAKLYSSFPWEISFKEHISIFIIYFSYLLFQIKDQFLNKFKNSNIDRFYFLLLIFLISNLNTHHNFIRLINSFSIIFFIIFISKLKEKNKSYFNFQKLQIITLLILFSYNIIAIYKRTTRDTYQATYLYGDITKFLTKYTWQHFRDRDE
jgi:hypothetical protein